MAPKKILFCTDFSDNSVPARTYAIDFASAFNAELLILHVINSSQLGYSTPGEGVPLDVRAMLERIQQSAEKALELIAAECRKGVPSCRTYSFIGNPIAEILRFAEEQAVELIVMGTHGWTGFKHLIMGSTATSVVRSANCPVLTVRSSPKA